MINISYVLFSLNFNLKFLFELYIVLSQPIIPIMQFILHYYTNTKLYAIKRITNYFISDPLSNLEHQITIAMFQYNPDSINEHAKRRSSRSHITNASTSSSYSECLPGLILLLKQPLELHLWCEVKLKVWMRTARQIHWGCRRWRTGVYTQCYY